MCSARSEKLFGYTGKLLRVNLSEEKVLVEETDTKVLRQYLGGVGYGAKLLYAEIPRGIDPLGSENKLIFTTGPMTGTMAPGAGFAEVCCKSPLTDVWCEAKCGGEWGGTLRKAGYDFLVIEGKAKRPKYIVINNGKVEIKSATRLKSKTVSQKNELIKKEIKDEKFETAVIGPAGESLVRFANIMVGGRAFGRCGAGAVMGSKNLLAIAVKGNGNIPVAEPERFRKAVRAGNKKVLDATNGEGMAPGGTTGDIPSCDGLGDIPTKNWRSNSWGKGEELYAHFENANLLRANSCYKGCVLRCGRIARVESGKWKTPVHEGSEYESICAFTFFVLNDDMDAAVHATYLCNEYGLDTISTGGVIAFAMDCYEQGIIYREETDGLALSWGDAETIVELVRRIANRQGIGGILGEGTRRASQQIGKGSEMLAMEVKGLEGPAHDGRSGKALAIMYGTANRGMCHIHPLEGMAYDSLKNDFGLVPFGAPDPETIGNHSEEGKGKITKLLQDFGILPDILGICKFYVYNGLHLPELAELISSLTGWDIDEAELLNIGERVYNLQRMFNAREGVRRKDDYIPERARQIPEFGEHSSVEECEIKEYDQMLDEYYEARSWNKETGVPTKEKLQQLGLGALAKL
ncbi:MAG: aldehyde:ferredoxin oxidoreductase [Dehalococcoidales bacterium]|jgi:aldehyde:ferredoxin oxidoreductase|nr:aldehyde:ferredoxin oxidoreductase [Dehalococcoidales bacterium]|tara:strand:+ start:3689 stop:5590 length:1902 start_codon:yes stop_codon:yes gene_type:complete